MMPAGNALCAAINRLDAALARAGVALVLIAMVGVVSCAPNSAVGKPQPGNRYKIVGPVYLHGDYNKSNKRKLTRETARAFVIADVHQARIGVKSHTAFQCDVPVGAIMTILGPAPKVMPLPFFANQYFVRFDPAIAPVELDVKLELAAGIDGDLDGLNPALFARLDEQSYVQAKNSLPTPPPCELYPVFP